MKKSRFTDIIQQIIFFFFNRKPFYNRQEGRADDRVRAEFILTQKEQKKKKD